LSATAVIPAEPKYMVNHTHPDFKKSASASRRNSRSIHGFLAETFKIGMAFFLRNAEVAEKVWDLSVQSGGASQTNRTFLKL
jgi:hypothetical protein